MLVAGRRRAAIPDRKHGKPMEHVEKPMIEALQHSLAVATLGLTDVILSSYDSELPPRISKIRRWSEECMIQTRKRKHISAAAKRSWDFFAEKIDRYGIKPEMDEDTARFRWAALIWTVLTFIEDVRRVCPLYGNGPQAKAWRYLHYHVQQLAEEQACIYAGADEIGTGIYEESAWALEGVEFKAPQLEVIR